MRVEQIGSATLYLCDCMKLLATLPDKSIDLAIVDPPYGNANGKIERTGGTWMKKFGYEIKKWDFAPPKEYFQELFRVSKFQIICGGNYFNLPISRNFIIFQKHIPENFSMAMCEYLWTNIDGNAKVFKTATFLKDRIHPCQKPVSLYKWLLLKYAKPDWKILDTHLGSGSIAIACNELGFNLLASEINKNYFNASCKRIKEAIKNHEKT